MQNPLAILPVKPKKENNSLGFITKAVSIMTARNIIEYPTINFNKDAECNPNNAVTLQASLYTSIRSTQAIIEYNIFADFDVSLSIRL